MGLLKVETKDAVICFSPQSHDEPFRPDHYFMMADAVIIEPAANLPPEAIGQFLDLSQKNLNSQHAFALSAGYKRDVWMTDCPLNLDYMKDFIERSESYRAPTDPLPFYIAGGALALAAGGTATRAAAGKKETTRRDFIKAAGSWAAGLGLLAAGGSSLYGLAKPGMDSAALKELNWDGLVLAAKKGEYGVDDPDVRKVTESRFNLTEPAMGLRNLIIARHTLDTVIPHAAAKRKEENRGGKPVIYFVYGAQHTGVARLLSDEKALERETRYWTGKDINRFIQTRHIDKAVRIPLGESNPGEEILPEIHNSPINELYRGTPPTKLKDGELERGLTSQAPGNQAMRRRN